MVLPRRQDPPAPSVTDRPMVKVREPHRVNSDSRALLNHPARSANGSNSKGAVGPAASFEADCDRLA